MEAYKTVCRDCGCIHFWTDQESSLGKTPEELALMDKMTTACVRCGSKNVKTGLDHESEIGRILDAKLHFFCTGGGIK